MANIKENLEFYDAYNWTGSGEEWSVEWGSTFNFWYATLLPRIGLFLPADRIVEIGCGHGRISEFLAQHCEHLELFDISSGCVDHCAAKFADSPNVRASLNDGSHLPSLQTNSVDFMFSIYSLVHSDANTIQAYIEEAARTLTVDGVFFLHHSNCAVYCDDPVLRGQDINVYRDMSVSAELVRNWAKARGMRCIRQELVNWGIDCLLSDCFSILVKHDSAWDGAAQEIMNPNFYEEMKYLRRLSDHYQSPILSQGGES